MSTELAVQAPENSSWDRLLAEAKYLGGSGFFPQITNMNQAVAICLLGRDLGLSPSQALYSVNVIEGKPSLSAGLMSALIFKHHGGNALQFTETTTERCTIAYRRRDADQGGVYTYTIEDAKAAGLAGKKNWTKDAASMLRARAISNVARLAFPDILSGCYIPEEMEPAAPPPPTLQPDPTPPTTANPLEGQTEPEEATFEEVAEETVTNRHGDQVVASTGEVVTPKYEVKQPTRFQMEPGTGSVIPVPMTDEQRAKILELQLAIGTTDVVEEMTMERAAQHIRELVAHYTKQKEAKAKPKTAKAKREEAKVDAPVAKALPVPAAAAGTEVGKQLIKGRDTIKAVSGFEIHLTNESLTNEVVGRERREKMLHLYHALVAGRGNGALTDTEKIGVTRLLQELRGHDTIPEIVSHESVAAFVGELLWEKRTKQEDNASVGPEPTAEDKAKDAARLAPLLAEQAEKEKNTPRQSTIEEDNAPNWEGIVSEE